MLVERVGIREYVSIENTSLSATIKYRITDFIVEEIDPEGQVCEIPEGALQELQRMQQKSKQLNEEHVTAFEGKKILFCVKRVLTCL